MERLRELCVEENGDIMATFEQQEGTAASLVMLKKERWISTTSVPFVRMPK